MAMAVFALTSVAANYQLSGMQLVPGAKEMLQKNVADFNEKIMSNDPSVISRTSTDSKGNVWTGRFLNYGPNWHTYFTMSDGSKPTWEDMPFYEVSAIVFHRDAQGNLVNWYQGILFYPAKSVLVEGEDTSLEGSTPCPIDVLVESGYDKFAVMEAGYVNMYDETTWGMINNEWFGVQSVFNGTYGYPDAGSALTISRYDRAASEIGMLWQGTWTEDGADTTSGSFATSFDGEAFITGFDKTTFNGDFTEQKPYCPLR